MNPLDLKGPEFLVFYCGLLAMVSVLAFMVRRFSLGRAEFPQGATDLDPYEVAYLSGGIERATQAVIANLYHRKLLKVDLVGRSFDATGELPTNAHPLERELHGSARLVDYDMMRGATIAYEPQLRSRLERLGLLPSQSMSSRARMLPALLVGLVVFVGIAKILIGLDRGRPVGFLFVLVLIAFAVAVLFLVLRVHASRAGQVVIGHYKRRNGALWLNSTSDPTHLSGNDLALAVGLFGVGMLAAPHLLDVQLAMRQQQLASDGSSSSSWAASSCGSTSSCGSSCGGGCGGGCGGCG